MWPIYPASSQTDRLRDPEILANYSFSQALLRKKIALMTDSILYGIPNCDTVKKARRFLDKQDYQYRFHDFRKDGCDKKLIESWIKSGADASLINKRSTTWKSLDEKTKGAIEDAISGLSGNKLLAQLSKTQLQSIFALLVESPTLIKRPVFSQGEKILIGFKEQDYQSII